MSAPDFAKRPDKLNKYLEGEAKAFIFAALSPDFLDRNGYPAGVYQLDYYIGGELADAVTFELK